MKKKFFLRRKQWEIKDKINLTNEIRLNGEKNKQKTNKQQKKKKKKQKQSQKK